MLDPKILRNHPELVESAMAKRHISVNLSRYATLESERKTLQTQLESLQAERNSLAKTIGQAKAQGRDTSDATQQATKVNQAIAKVEQQFNTTKHQQQEIVLHLANLPHTSVPEGADESANQCLLHWGEQPEFLFSPKDHFELGNKDMDGEGATMLAGSRFMLLRGDIAKLHRALAQWMLDTHITEHGYNEVYTPFLVLPKVLEGSGQLPKFSDDLYHTNDMVLIPTAEAPLANLVRERIVPNEQLPMRLVAHTPCFRREAGSYGKDTRGMFRQHQFEKVELVQITNPASSWDALEEMTGHAEAILQKLNLPYRKVVLCGGDLGFSAAKTYDLEVWLPGQNAYREISSCSNCVDFQARRMQARWRNPQTNKPELLHTLNGSGVAVGRCLIAVMENYQCSDGSIRLPEVLQPYMHGKSRIHPR